MLIFAKARRPKIHWPVTGPATGPVTGPTVGGKTGGAGPADQAPDIDLERVVYDPEYRKRVVRRLNRAVGTDKAAKPS